jgi:hypothetical protein
VNPNAALKRRSPGDWPYSPVVRDLHFILRQDDGFQAAVLDQLPGLAGHEVIVAKMESGRQFNSAVEEAVSQAVRQIADEPTRDALLWHFGISAGTIGRSATERRLEASRIAGYSTAQYSKERRGKNGDWLRCRLTRFLQQVEKKLDNLQLGTGQAGGPLAGLQRIAPGSVRYRLADVVSNDKIYVGAPWRRASTGALVDDEPVDSWLEGALTNTPNGSRYLVIAAPGSGKSTIALRLSRRMQDSGKQIVHIDLRLHKDEREDEGFATAEWLTNRYSTAADATSPPIFILDALDELLTGMRVEAIATLLDRPLFTQAAIVTCRRSYFERYLADSPFARSFADRLELLGLPKDGQDALVARYLKAAYPSEGDELAVRVSTWLDESPARRTLCSVPLHLLLAVESVAPERDDLDSISDLVGLWQAHVMQVLSLESERTNLSLDRNTWLSLLSQVAWHFYDEEGAGSTDPPIFTTAELRAFLDSLGEPASGLVAPEDHALLVGGFATRIAEISPVLRFTHASLHTFLVARHLYETVLSGDPYVAYEAFSKFISGEVSRMLLEFLTRLSGQPRLAATARTTLEAVVDHDKPTDEASPISAARWRIARQQAAYYIGSLGGASARHFLVARLEHEEDLWVSRGMAIALSLAGDSSALDQQIDMRRAERQAGGDAPRCEANLGYHLSFSGDQPLDILAPDVDQGEPTCSLTVATLVRQLELPEKRGSWRSTLFTMVDLAHHRPVSHVSFDQAVTRDRDRLAQAVEGLSADPVCSEWPETKEVTSILERYS